MTFVNKKALKRRSARGAELQNLLKLFEYIMDYPGPAPVIKRRTAQYKQSLSIIY